MKQRIMEEIMQRMLPHLDNAQLQKLQEVLEHSLYNYEISGKLRQPKTDGDNNNKNNKLWQCGGKFFGKVRKTPLLKLTQK